MAGNFIKSRASKDDLERAMRRIRRLSGASYGVDKNSEGYRLELASGRNVSPRLRLRAFVEWLHAFEAGLDQARREQEVSDASGPVPVCR